jgi:4-hydroxy-3-polyprenylbenzoate decarboxylase
MDLGQFGDDHVGDQSERVFDTRPAPRGAVEVTKTQPAEKNLTSTGAPHPAHRETGYSTAMAVSSSASPATTSPSGEVALLVSGASGGELAARLAADLLGHPTVDTVHLVVTAAATRVLTLELGPEWSTGAGFRDRLLETVSTAATVRVWDDDDLTAPIASGSHPLVGTVILPCSAGTAGAVANGISRGLVQRAADVALKQRWPLVMGIRETPLSEIVLRNLLRLARAGAHIAPPVPAFYLRPDPETAWRRYVDHYCLRVLDLLGLHRDEPELRWSP